MTKQIDWGRYLRPEASTTLWQQMGLVLRLSVPAILAEITAIAMQYIDAAMVGSLGERASAAIGLVSSSTWLLGGLSISLATGFSVQVAHLTGAGRDMLPLLEEAYQAFSEKLSAGISGEDWQTLQALLKRLEENSCPEG